MGNRAAVIFQEEDEISPIVYLHWNGGPESVYQFVEELNRRCVRCDAAYECARFIHIIGDFMDQDKAGSLSLGVSQAPKAIAADDAEMVVWMGAAGDNGVYVINRGAGWVRRFHDGKEAPAEDVTKELKEAKESDYWTKKGGFATLFKKLRPKIDNEDRAEAFKELRAYDPILTQ